MSEINIENENFYKYNEPKERTKERLVQIKEMGLQEVSFAGFGIPGICSGLYIERIWDYSEEQWNSYINDYLKPLIKRRKKEMIDEVIPHLTREQTLTLWTKPITSNHCLIEKKHGDGLQLIWFQTMDSRPFHYLIRVDSSLNLELEEYQILNEGNDGDFSEMIMEMIEEECDNIDRYEEMGDGTYFDPQEPIEILFEYEWPMFSLGAGYSYGVVDIEFY